MRTEQVLEVQHLKTYFPTQKGILHAVDDVSFSMEKGKTLGVVGESGCGKSTLGRTILHLLESTDGRILFHGEDVTRVDRRRLRKLREHMQIIFQDPFSSLNPRMSVREIIKEPLILKGGRTRQEMEEKVEELMDVVGLDRRLAFSYPHELDGGRRQRIGIARALALDPEFLVCDEPVSALDVSIQAQILNLMEDLQEERGLTYMFITHDLSVVRYISHEIAVMYLGQIVEMASCEGLFDHPLHPYTNALIDAIPLPQIGRRRHSPLKGELSSPVDPPDICRFAKRCPFVKEQCRTSCPSLKEITPGHFVACYRAGE